MQGDNDLSGHVEFFLGAFLPWATDGSLFTSTLTSTREKTVCRHGEAIVAVIAAFVSATQIPSSSVSSSQTNSTTTVSENRPHQTALLGVIRFISDAGGRIFQSAVLYLLEGLIKGLKKRAEENAYEMFLTRSELAETVGLSRLAGLPEISSDLLCVYCQELCKLLSADLELMDLPGYTHLNTQIIRLRNSVDQSLSSAVLRENKAKTEGDGSPLRSFIDELYASKHTSIQGSAYAPACKSLIDLLDHVEARTLDHDELCTVLQALWEEAERREFGRPVAIHLPPLLFHPRCIEVCIAQDSTAAASEVTMIILLSKALKRLQQLSHGRSYVLGVLVTSIREAVFKNPAVIGILPFGDFILDYLNNPPTIKPEFLFEVAAAEKLQQSLPHRTYASYYGQREWHAYAALIDILRRFPEEQIDVAKHILGHLLQPWSMQRIPVLVKSPWKDTFQLQAMLLLSDYCISEPEADMYLDSFMKALVLEPWPRYRYLLEWIMARLYIRFPKKSARILEDLQRLDKYSPIHIASLMKLGLLIAPYEAEAFTVDLATQLTCFSASPKVQIRHEANFAFPLVFDLASVMGWTNITSNPAFISLNNFIRGLDKFKTAPWTIRTLRLDAMKDFNVVSIFQGKYLTIESPETERVAYEDFLSVQRGDEVATKTLPPARIPLGDLPHEAPTTAPPAAAPMATSHPSPTSTAAPAFLQTKAGFDLDSLHPTSGPPSKQNQRPASVILIASLIDNPTNLGGLSRISESFGLEALYIDDLKKIAHKDFKATSVTSEKHFPIHQLKVADVPAFLLGVKSKGYEVVGIEQTDRSGILGQEQIGERDEDGNADVATATRKALGTLPRKCVLVLGSEKEGIAVEVLAVIDRCVEIKTVGVTRSLSEFLHQPSPIPAHILRSILIKHDSRRTDSWWHSGV